MAARSALLGAAGPALKLAVLTLLMCTAMGMASFFSDAADFVSDTASSAVDTVGDTVQEATGDCGDAKVLCRIPIASIDSEVRFLPSHPGFWWAAAQNDALHTEYLWLIASLSHLSCSVGGGSSVNIFVDMRPLLAQLSDDDLLPQYNTSMTHILIIGAGLPRRLRRGFRNWRGKGQGHRYRHCFNRGQVLRCHHGSYPCRIRLHWHDHDGRVRICGGRGVPDIQVPGSYGCRQMQRGSGGMHRGREGALRGHSALTDQHAAGGGSILFPSARERI